MRTFRRKSATMRLTSTSGIEYSALKSTRKSENNPRTNVIPVEIRISVSLTKPYLSHFFEIFGSGIQYIVRRIKKKLKSNLSKKFSLFMELRDVIISTKTFISEKNLRNGSHS
jgi:hypothetical protein